MQRRIKNEANEISRRVLGATAAIYVLFDPRYPTIIRYVGKTKNWPRRLTDHQYPNRLGRTPIVRWCRKLRNGGITLSGRVVEWTKDWESSEKKIRQSCVIVGQQRRKIGAYYGEKAVQSFDRELLWDLFPLSFIYQEFGREGLKEVFKEVTCHAA